MRISSSLDEQERILVSFEMSSGPQRLITQSLSLTSISSTRGSRGYFLKVEMNFSISEYLGWKCAVIINVNVLSQSAKKAALLQSAAVRGWESLQGPMITAA